jgi:hypothetical protein
VKNQTAHWQSKSLWGFLLLLLTAVALTGCLPKKKGEPVGEGVSTRQEAGKEESYSGTLEKMMALGIPLKCTWKKDESYYGSSWLKGKNSYGEITQEGKTTKVIFKDNCLWSWEEGNPQGFKMCTEPTTETEVTEGEGGVDWTKVEGGPPADIDYQCLPAVIPDSRFNPPANINFMSMEEMMNPSNQ